MCDPDYIEEPEERRCTHCGKTKTEAVYLADNIHCSYGQGLLHCSNCYDYCDACKERFCHEEIEVLDCGETYGEIHLCENCKKELGL